jgi:TorA maturation chaperone TorD
VTEHALEAEDEARAAIYGLIARLFYAAPDQNVLGQMLNADLFAGADTALARAWRELVAAVRTASPLVLENEHTELFVGTGKTEVSPYLTHYVIKYATENPLVDLRQHLAGWGLGRRGDANEPEDHISAECEVMRFAIAMQHRSLEDQKDFFERFLYPGAISFCDAVSASPKAAFYGAAARFSRAFFEMEREAFAML